MSTRIPCALQPEDVRYKANLETLGIHSSDDLSPSPTTIGQPEALEAFSMGLHMRHPGYNIFLAGAIGTGRFSSTRMQIERSAITCPRVFSFSYVYNFENADRPLLIRLPRGLGRRFQRRLNRLRDSLFERITSVLKSEPLTKHAERILKEYQEKTAAIFSDFEQRVQADGFQVVQTEAAEGHVHLTDLFPVVEGEPVPMEQALATSPSTPEEETRQTALKEHYTAFKKELLELVQHHQILRTEFQEKLSSFHQHQVREALQPSFDEIVSAFASHDPKVEQFLAKALNEILEYLHLFQTAAQDESPEQDQARNSAESLLFTLRANLVTEPPPEGTGAQSCPIIEENYPTHRNLFGTIETHGDGSAPTFMDIKGGSLLQANGGFLVIGARDLLLDPKAYETLKRTLRKGDLEITPREDGPAAQIGLQPEPIPIDVKVILVGEPGVYEMLRVTDPDFRKIFKVKAEFDSSMPLTEETLKSYLAVVKRIQLADRLKRFNRGALEALLEEGVRRSGSRLRLTTHFKDIADLMREADQLADEEEVASRHVHHALKNQHLRHNLAERNLHQALKEGKILIDVAGSRVGQINGLAVYHIDDMAFGMPARISATTSMGRDGVVNIEREADLSGNIHDKGILILSGFLSQTFAQDKPLSLKANLAFEQSYVMIDGDSASCAELLAVLSSLARCPLRQDLAVTGSLNQFGEVQPVGGVNEKIEGFFSVCRIKGLRKGQGIIMPAQNISELNLSLEVTREIEKGTFAIYPVTDFKEALELLTGGQAEEILDSVNKRLELFARTAASFSQRT